MGFGSGIRLNANRQNLYYFWHIPILAVLRGYFDLVVKLRLDRCRHMRAEIFAVAAMGNLDSYVSSGSDLR